MMQKKSISFFKIFTKPFFSPRVFLSKITFSTLDSTNYKSYKNTNSLLSFIDLENKIASKKINCKGCGVLLQIDDPKKEGYINFEKLQESEENLLEKTKVEQMEEVKNENININELQKDEYKYTYHNIIPDEYVEKVIKEPSKKKDNIIKKIEINDLEVLQALDEAKDKIGFEKEPKKNKKKQIVCERCHKLKYERKLNENIEIEINRLTLKDFIKKIYSEMTINSIVFYVIDITNLNATLIDEVYNLKYRYKSRMILIINKMDVLPKEVVESEIRFNLRTYLKNKFEEIKNDDLYFTSSLTGEGFDKIIEFLKKMKGRTDHNHKLYIIGCTNSGKSTFINKLIKKTSRHSSEYYHSPFENKQIVADLTESPFPSTTLKTNEIESLHLGMRIYDTPGIPNEVIYPKIMHDLLKKTDLLILKKIKIEAIELIIGKSLWIGGFLRFDYNEQSTNTLSPIVIYSFCNHKVNLHKTSIIRSNEIYIKNYGNILNPVLKEDFKEIKFVKYEISLNFLNSICLKELEIEGIGCFGFKSSTKENNIILTMYLPEGIRYNLRKPIYSLKKEANINKIERRIRPKYNNSN